MIPYPRGLLLDNANNYGIVKTETVFGFAPNHGQFDEASYNTTIPMEWIFASEKIQTETLDDEQQTSKLQNTKVQSRKAKSIKKKIKANNKRKSKGVKKCVFKVLKGKGNKRKRSKGGKYKKMIVPLVLGLLAAKSLLIPVALKALAFLSAKGLMMGFFSTVLASIISLKGMFEHNHGYNNRKDDSKTQVEIIHVPSKSEDHHFYEDNYKRGDILSPVPVPNYIDKNNIQKKRFKIISREVVSQ